MNSNDLPLSFVLDLSNYLTDSIDDFALNMDDHGVLVIAEEGYRKSLALARASKMDPDTCSKKVAAENMKYIPEEDFDKETRWKFMLAHYAAAAAKAAIVSQMDAYMKDHYKETGQFWTAELEASIGDMELSGTVDILLTCEVPSALDPRDAMYLHRIPVEIKRTDADGYSGINSYAVWQTITYMDLLDSQFGIVLTLYNGKENTYKAWPVVAVDGGWMLHDGLLPARLGSDFPSDENGYTFYSHREYMRIVADRKKWMRMSEEELRSTPGPFTDPFARPCAGKYIEPYIYKTNSQYGRKGSVKPGTGIVFGLCPLYAMCYKDRLEDRNVPTNPLPDRIDVMTIHNRPEFRFYGDE